MTRLLVLNLTVFGLVAGALCVAVALLHVVERGVGRFVSHRLGWGAVLVTGWIGVPVHELSHLVTAVIFRHRIVGWSLFDPDPTTGTLGYVRHAHTRPSLYQLAGNFFIGIAPLVGGAVALGLLLVWMVPPARLLALATESGLLASSAPLAAGSAQAAALGVTAPGGGAALAAGLWRALGDFGAGLAGEIWRARTWWLPLQLYLCAAVAAHLAPSARDLAGGLRGALALVVLLAAGAAVAAALGAGLGAVLVAVPVMALLVALTLALQALHVLGAAAFATVFGRR